MYDGTKRQGNKFKKLKWQLLNLKKKVESSNFKFPN